ncbi:MAG: IS1380 family transposase [Actinomycetales bacterium]|nr:IS1380 family transposase [Actinomycetales bacterium]
MAWSKKLAVEVGGAGTVAHAGVVLPRLLADRLGLTADLAAVVARAGFTPLRHRGRLLVDAACALAAGATALSDVEALTRQEELFGPGGGASDTTVLRGLDELADRLGSSGLPGRRLARAMARARARAWTAIVERHGGLPAVRVATTELRRSGEDAQPGRAVTVVRLDATVIQAASDKDGAEPNFKGYGFHPLTAWCTNIGDALAAMLRPGSAGSFTASDHVAVLDAAITQLPAAYRGDLLVTVDGAGASHDLVDHLTELNTARRADGSYGRRGRRLEYSVGWPVDARTRAAIEELTEADWTTALTAKGTADEKAQVVELTGLLRHSVGGDQLTTWPEDLRVIARRTPREPGEQAELGEDARWRYGAFATNTTTGQVQFLDARHRTQAHVEDKIKESKACGAERLPSTDYHRNSAWLQLVTLAVSLLAWLRLIALDGDLVKAEPKMLRFRLFSAPARLITHARKKILKIPPGWAWATDLTTAWSRIHALHPA